MTPLTMRSSLKNKVKWKLSNLYTVLCTNRGASCPDTALQNFSWTIQPMGHPTWAARCTSECLSFPWWPHTWLAGAAESCQTSQERMVPNIAGSGTAPNLNENTISVEYLSLSHQSKVEKSYVNITSYLYCLAPWMHQRENNVTDTTSGWGDSLCMQVDLSLNP